MKVLTRWWLTAVLLVAFSVSAMSQTFQVLHAFSGPPNDGDTPTTSVAITADGNVFGTTNDGGVNSACDGNCGVAFELSKGFGHWKENVFYNFGPSDGNSLDLYGPLAIDSSGNIYGTQYIGGDPACNCGAIYQLTETGGVWTENVLHAFAGGTSDGAFSNSGLVPDGAGNLYGSTQAGGTNGGGNGIIFELTPNGDGTWNYNIIYQFMYGVDGSSDGSGPWGQLTIDSLGNIYGTTYGGGIYGYGTAFRLSPSGGAWTESVLFNFTLDYGSTPFPTGVVEDAAGNLYGTTQNGGAYGVGTIYELTPTKGFWNRTILHTFTGSADGALPYSILAIDASGNLYGAADFGGAFGFGNIYKMARADGKWKETVLHQITNGTDGRNPFPAVVLDSTGNLYGVCVSGGAYGYGVVFKITP